MKPKNKLINSINTDLYIFQFIELLDNYMQKTYTEIGLTAPQLYVMAALKYLPPPVIATDISKWLNRSMNAVNATLNTMVRDGLVKRNRSLKDRRVVRLALTSKSEDLFDRATIYIKELPSKVMSPLSNNELESMISSLQKLINNLLGIMDFRGEPSKLDSYHRVDTVKHILEQQKIGYDIIDFYQFLSTTKITNK